ncbi:hypothetical protein ACEZCY_04565 [Streptacidiphilus sp. N1-12]|uniref:Uncharacterized protein n=2 Tax=Streptacidiphilus alkalitolerans TaxID=3342712 RepID=A0ABV6V4A2_9ACTN
MADLTGKSSFAFPERLTDQEIKQIEDALATHGARVDAKAQTFTPDSEPSTHTFACTLEASNQMAADNAAGVVLGRALHDCGYLADPRR